jgi:glycosyltransferase involved in cell wall biosynthesis
VKISILIPAHNEESTIREVIESSASKLLGYNRNGLHPKFEFIVLDDGSTDNTYFEILNSDFWSLSKKIIRNNSPSGIAGAFETLYDAASGDWILLIPGDHQWRIDSVIAILNQFSDLGGKVAVCSIRKHKTGYSVVRKFTSSVFSLLARLVVKNKSRLDPGSIKLLPNFPKMSRKFRSTPSNEIERLILARRITGQRIALVKVSTYGREKGKSSSGGLKLLFVSCIEFLRIVKFYSSN